MKEPTIDRQRTVVTHGQASVIAQPRIGALHDPAPLVSPQGSAVLRWRLAPSFTMRNDQFDAAPSQLLAQRIRSSFLLSSISPHLWFLVIQKPQFLLFTSTSRSHRQLGACLLRRHVSGVPVQPVRVVLPVTLLVLAVGGCRAPHRACQIVC